MKRFAVVILVVLALPLATFAKSECPGCRPYGNTGGTLIGTVDGLSLSSTLTDYKGRLGANLGIVTIYNRSTGERQSADRWDVQ